MTGPAEKKGPAIFIGLMLLVLVLALAAYSLTGDMGMEERFTRALGLTHGSEEVTGGAGSGLSLEGSPLLYAGVLGILAVACYAAYRYFSV